MSKEKNNARLDVLRRYRSDLHVREITTEKNEYEFSENLRTMVARL